MLSALLFFRLTGTWGSFFLFRSIPFHFNTFAGFVSGFHSSRNLGAWTGNRFSFSVARVQMLVAWGDRAPLEHSLAYVAKGYQKSTIRLNIYYAVVLLCKQISLFKLMFVSVSECDKNILHFLVQNNFHLPCNVGISLEQNIRRECMVGGRGHFSTSYLLPWETFPQLPNPRWWPTMMPYTYMPIICLYCRQPGNLGQVWPTLSLFKQQITCRTTWTTTLIICTAL